MCNCFSKYIENNYINCVYFQSGWLLQRQIRSFVYALLTIHKHNKMAFMEMSRLRPTIIVRSGLSEISANSKNKINIAGILLLHRFQNNLART